MGGAVPRFPCGYAVQSATDPQRSRPVIMDVWYPARDDAVDADHDYDMSSEVNCGADQVERVVSDTGIAASRPPDRVAATMASWPRTHHA
jgi:hypothetical protein